MDSSSSRSSDGTRTDELVVVEGAVDFVKNGVGEAVGAEKDDRVKMVGLGTKGPDAHRARE